MTEGPCDARDSRFADALGECRHCAAECGSCPDVIRSELRLREARAASADCDQAAALRELVAASSHLSALGRADLAAFRMDDLIVCPRCEGQRYDVGSCGLCRNVGWLDSAGEALKVPGV